MEFQEMTGMGNAFTDLPINFDHQGELLASVRVADT